MRGCSPSPSSPPVRGCVVIDETTLTADLSFRAMEPESKLLIVEEIIPEGNTFSIGKLLDLEVFVMSGGCERTEAEFKKLPETCGFKLSRTVSMQESTYVIECIS